MNTKARIYTIAYFNFLQAQQAVEDASIINIEYVLELGTKKDRFLIHNMLYWGRIVKELKR